jgi:hypothetical protein
MEFILARLNAYADYNGTISHDKEKNVKLIDQNSLASTLDSVNEAFFYNQPLSKSERTQIARWIASRQGLPRSYAGMFAPMGKDFQNGLVLFTGEKVFTRAGISHILGQESCRTLLLLDVGLADVKAALEKATAGFMPRLKQYGKADEGTYCCATCSCAFWRHLSAGGLENNKRLLTNGIKTLKSFRDGKGRWNRFPFYYTLLVLNGTELPASVEEMQYAAPACERLLKRDIKRDKISKRRRILAERILEKC